MQIQDLEYSETVQRSIRGGLEVNSTTIVVLSSARSRATALAYFGNATAISQSFIGISLK